MSQTDNSKRRRPAAPKVSQAVQRQIDENLKRLYQQTLDEELPESLLALVERLREDGGGR